MGEEILFGWRCAFILFQCIVSAGAIEWASDHVCVCVWMYVCVNSVDNAEKSNKTKKTEKISNYEFVYKNKQQEEEEQRRNE